MIPHLTLMIADDHPLVRQGIVALFSHYPNLKLIGEAGNGRELLDKMKKLRPDIVLLDLEMPVMSGDETLKAIRKQFPEVKVIIISMHFDHELVNHFMDKGVNAYIPKAADTGILIDAIYSVNNDAYYFDNISEGATKEKGSDALRFLLTAKEIEVLKLICAGLSNNEIAEKLTLSVNTVDYHRKNIHAKTKIKKATLLTLFAVRNGIISVNYRG